MPAAEFDKWYSAAETGGLAAKGQKLAGEKGCLGCHSTDGTRKVGPSFKGIYGMKETVVTDGNERSVSVDDEYIKNSVRRPNIDIVKGYQAIMPLITVTDEELNAMVEYLKTVK
jgi:cytochrome c oxidase subunit 2